MDERLERYAERQRRFWNVTDREVARFERVDVVSGRSEEAWNALACRDIKRVLEGIDVQETWTIVEIGCGVGRLISKLRDQTKAARIIGVDIAENMIAFAVEALGATPGIELHVNSGYDLNPIGDETADFVFANDVFIHIFDVDIARHYCNEVWRILRPGGRFRFNVRHFDPAKAFSKSLGGQYARLLYRTGLRSTLNRWTSDQAAEFNGVQYRKHDLRTLVENANLAMFAVEAVDQCLWCTCGKPERLQRRVRRRPNS
jgi:ubiquinone/menaquinone biosynthesis C-methylase UbiE